MVCLIHLSNFSINKIEVLLQCLYLLVIVYFKLVLDFKNKVFAEVIVDHLVESRHIIQILAEVSLKCPAVCCMH